jgi:hypothetical protein
VKMIVMAPGRRRRSVFELRIAALSRYLARREAEW